MLQEVLDLIKNKDSNYGTAKKAIILILDDTDEETNYTTTWHQAGMKMSECIALCAVMQQGFIDTLDY